MVCPQCNCTFDEAVTDTCPKCHHRPGTSMYLDGSVKIDDNSIIVDEHGAEAGPGPEGRPPYPHQERRRRPRPTVAELPPKNRPAGGAKSLAISVSLGALLLAGSVGVGLYYLKYKTREDAVDQPAPRPLVLPSPSAPEPTYKTPRKATPADTVSAAPDKTLQEKKQVNAEKQPQQPPAADAAVPTANSADTGKKSRVAPRPAASLVRQQRAAKPPIQAKPAPAPTAKKALKSGKYYLLCGSFKNRQKALAATAKLQQSKYAAFVEKADLGAKGIWYRIKVGGFSSRQKAARARDAIKRTLNFDALVRKNR